MNEDIPTHHATLTDSDGLTPHQITKLKNIILKHFDFKHDVVCEYGSNGTNCHIHMIIESSKRTDKIRDILKKLYPKPTGDVREYWRHRIMCCSNKKTLAETFTYHRKEIDPSSPYRYPDNTCPKHNDESYILSSTYSPEAIDYYLQQYEPDIAHNLIHRRKSIKVSKHDLIHTLDAYASQVFPRHCRTLTHKEYMNIIYRMTTEGYVLHYTVTKSTYHWLNVFRGETNNRYLEDDL